MTVLIEVGHHLALGFAGPVLPADKSLILLAGDGYIVGYFLGSVFLPDVADFSAATPSPPAADLDAEVEIWRRRWGIAIAATLALIWLVGELQTPHNFTLASTDHDLFSAIPLLGIGALLGALCAPLVAKRLTKNPARQLSRLSIEHRMGERYARVFGTVLAALYVGVWLNPW